MDKKVLALVILAVVLMVIIVAAKTAGRISNGPPRQGPERQNITSTHENTRLTSLPNNTCPDNFVQSGNESDRGYFEYQGNKYETGNSWSYITTHCQRFIKEQWDENIPKFLAGKNYNLMDESLLARARAALENGNVITDPASDWESTSQAGDNPSFYELDAADVLGLIVSTDNEYLFLKLSSTGKLPDNSADFPVVDGDRVTGYLWSVVLQNKAEIAASILLDNEELDYDFSYQTEPTGIREPEDKRYAKKYNDPYYFGGFGSNEILMAIPLANLDLSDGQNIRISASLEARSTKYHHASFDSLEPIIMSF